MFWTCNHTPRWLLAISFSEPGWPQSSMRFSVRADAELLIKHLLVAPVSWFWGNIPRWHSVPLYVEHNQNSKLGSIDGLELILLNDYFIHRDQQPERLNRGIRQHLSPPPRSSRQCISSRSEVPSLTKRTWRSKYLVLGPHADAGDMSFLFRYFESFHDAH
jgi:hypothetical protein